MTTANGRTADHSIDPLFLDRWSPRAYDGRPLADEAVLSLFEAARWAPSSYNQQPWRLVYARRDTPDWPRFLDLLVPGNRAWAERAGLLVFAVSDAFMRRADKEPTPSYSHSFDTGSAWTCLALQATRLGLQAHAMVGFDQQRAPAVLNLPPDHRIEAAIAVGHPADRASLSPEQQAREVPNGRNPVSSFAFEGGFPPR